MKFKAGDKVKITKAMCEKDKKYEGKVVTIKYVDPYDSDRYKVKENCRPWRGCELELVEESEEIILKGVKNEQGFYEIRIPKKLVCVGSHTELGIIRIMEFKEKEEILDDIEKEYLSAVIKPFRDKVKYIGKNLSNGSEYISINVKGEWVIFPYFKKGTMYKRMEINKRYSLEELGL